VFRPLAVIAITLSILFIPGSEGTVRAQEDLLSRLPRGDVRGIKFGNAEDGYRVLIEYFEADEFKLFHRLIELPKTNEQSVSYQFKTRFTTGYIGDASLLFGATDNGWYFAAISQDLLRQVWTIGYYNAETKDYNVLATSASDWINDMTGEDLNEMKVNVLRRGGEPPLITLFINGVKMNELPAIHPEDHPQSPIGNIGFQCSAYPFRGTTGYVFTELARVSP
jgi:hypothetical protein